MNAIVKRALDTVVSIASDSPAVLASVSAFIDTYPSAVAEPTVTYVLDVAQGTVLRDGATIAEGFREDWFAPFVERDLYEVVSERAAADAFLVHAAAVVRGGRALLLFGASGAGKTTMCRGLVARGANYVTDEIALVDGDVRVRGVPRPLALLPDDDPPDPPTRALHGQAAGYTFVARDGAQVTARFFQLAIDHIEHGASPIAAVVHLRHAPSDPAGIRALRPSQALSALWEQRLRTGTCELDVATNLLGRVPSFELTTHDVDGACRDIDAIFDHS